MSKHNPKFLELVNQIKSHITEISIQDLKKLLDGKQDFHLIDVRETEEWSLGHIPKAIHLSKGTIERDIENHISNPNDPIILYCRGGFRSALATEALQRMGYKNVISLADGFGAWLDAGYPIEHSIG